MTAAPIAVVGDVMLDVDLIGAARRLSPDAPVPVLDDVATSCRPGGAALAATIAASGRPVSLIAPLIDDEAGRELVRLLPDNVELIALGGVGETAVKTRIRAGEHAVARLDRGSPRIDVTDVPDGRQGRVGRSSRGPGGRLRSGLHAPTIGSGRR